ncbi:trehalose-6-phosphate synthase [Catellatospora chokoriensis]|nr:trehalose-6-phosphate synthase [Catellatospora chokoriensis]
MRIVTCSNSAVQATAGQSPQLVPVSPGGLVPMVAALMRHHGGHWVYVGNGDHADSTAVAMAGTTTTLHGHRVDAHSAAQHDRMSIEVLQWLMHYLHDPLATPISDPAIWDAWGGYQKVNLEVATRMHDLADPADLLLVNDHQFLLVGGRLRELRPARPGPVVYFHQTPWCDADNFALLPGRVRTAILDSLLACDVVGFHARRWARAFLSCCARDLPEAHVAGDHVVHRGRRTRVVAAPGPADAATLQRLAADPLTVRWRDRLTAQAEGRRLLVRAERMDLWKNVAGGLLAYERLLAGRPELARGVWHCALLSGVRRPTERHRRYEQTCAAIAARINARHGGDGPEPVTLLYAEPGDNTQHRVVAALQLACATLVNPTFDGLNLVAKESLLVNPTAPVVLSVNAGVYDELHPYTLGVDPFDVSATAAALGHALDGAHELPRWPGSAATESAAEWCAALVGEPHCH